LYLVPTPIGNLEDVTLRSLRVLREAGLILAEDTRTTRRLLDRYKITGQLESYTEHSHAVRAPRVMEALATSDVALVSEAGMPGINDPGQGLVAEVVTAGYQVIGLPGASAVPLAVAVAGFPIKSCHLPRFSAASFRGTPEIAYREWLVRPHTGRLRDPAPRSCIAA